MSFATEMQEVVTELNAVDELGNSVTFTQPGGSYDETTGKVTGGSPTVFATTCGGPFGVDPKLAERTLIQESDQFIIVEASQFTFTIIPALTTVTINSKVFAVVEVEPIRVNDTDVSYTVVIR